MLLSNYPYILLNYTSTLLHQFMSIIYTSIVYSAYTVSKCCTILKYCLFINIIWCSSFAGVIVIVPLTTIYASISSHRRDLNIEVLNLICLYSFNVPRGSSLISTKHFLLNLDGWFGASSNKFIIFWYSVIILI